MTTEPEPLRADLYPTETGRAALQECYLSPSGSDLLAWPGRDTLLVGESSLHLAELSSRDVYAVHWYASGDNEDFDRVAYTLQLDPHAFRSHCIELNFDLHVVGLHGIESDTPHLVCWRNDWLYVHDTFARLVSFPRNRVINVPGHLDNAV